MSAPPGINAQFEAALREQDCLDMIWLHMAREHGGEVGNLRYLVPIESQPPEVQAARAAWAASRDRANNLANLLREVQLNAKGKAA